MYIINLLTITRIPIPVVVLSIIYLLILNKNLKNKMKIEKGAEYKLFTTSLLLAYKVI